MNLVYILPAWKNLFLNQESAMKGVVRWRAPGPLAVGCVLLLGLAGCGSKNRPVFPVSGQVQVDGRPAPGALVIFHPVGDRGPEAVHPLGTVDDQGRFTLTSYTKGDGAPEGEYQVAVRWAVTAPAASPSEGVDGFVNRDL